MSELAGASLTRDPVTDPRWALVQRVADSAYFRKGTKLRAFLLYVCENTLLGRIENVREQIIGSAVFGRSPEYNLAEDNIVRVEAREVRKRLDLYFTGEGRNEPVVLDIPKGGYVPIFRARGDRASPPGELSGPIEIPRKSEEITPGPVPLPRSVRRPGRWLVRLFAAALLAALLSTGLLLRQNWKLRAAALPLTGVRSAGSMSDYSFYNELLGNLGLNPARETLVVLSNPKVAYAGDLLSGATRIDPRPFLSRVDSTAYTGMGEAVAAFHSGQILQFLHRPARLTQGRFLNWERLGKQDLVLLGGPRASEWAFENLPPSNFNFELNGISNAKPLPGEAAFYRRKITPVGPSEFVTDFGVIKMLASPYGFRTLLLAGGMSAGTAGIGELFASPDKMRDIYSRIRAASSGSRFPQNWEALISITVRDEIPIETSIVSVRPARSASAR